MPVWVWRKSRNRRQSVSHSTTRCVNALYTAHAAASCKGSHENVIFGSPRCLSYYAPVLTGRLPVCLSVCLSCASFSKSKRAKIDVNVPRSRRNRYADFQLKRYWVHIFACYIWYVNTKNLHLYSQCSVKGSVH